MSRGLFDDEDDFEPCDPTTPHEARARLSRQCRAILERLRAGPALNSELIGYAMKYTGRLSDLRKAGYRIDCETVDARAGLYRYTLR